MKDVFKEIKEKFYFTGNIKEDSQKLLKAYGQYLVAEHSIRVAKEARIIAKQYGENENEVEIAGLLHDISGIYENKERLLVAEKLQLNIVEEEKVLPLILHQKISRVMAKDLFQIKNKKILSAIECHTTLKKNASKMDMILFIADKIKWDQKGIPPYFQKVQSELKISLEKGALCYIEEAIKNVQVIHPWLKEAYEDLKVK
ncbi:HD domain-containing protein [Clostridium felsineum]|uniref:HD domain-containing protein n=1 Tax=Clostridium felsineum TaxID=36839 RepID=UPI00098C5D2C|nr:HD domain-containing protein [Clostridium felsineum]URZ04355.1 hypothetical protein CLAUR_044440 [Clostridium felsineum]